MPIQPELFVTDLARSLDFYIDVLGFEVTRHEPDGFTELARGDASLALNRHDILSPDHPIRAKAGETLGQGVEIVHYVEDIGSAHDRALASGWPLATPLTEQPWGLTDFRLIDPDSYYIRVSRAGPVARYSPKASSIILIRM